MITGKILGLSRKRSPKQLTRFGMTTLALILSLVATTLIPSPKVEAVTPPDSCFVFDAGSGTITDYLWYEGNTFGNPDCPRALDIPSTIGAVPVTGFAEYAFDSKDLPA